MNSSAKRRKGVGFTLIETLVAIAIAAVGLLTIFELFPTGFAASAKSQARVVSTTIACDILAACRRILSNPADSNFASLSWYVQRNTEAQALKYSNNYSMFGGVTGDPSYYWKIWIHEIVDPYAKYQSAIGIGLSESSHLLDSNFAYPDVVGLRRITVFVRGPFASSAATAGGANDPNWKSEQGGSSGSGRRASSAVEVRMIGFVANYKLAYATINRACGPDAIADDGTKTRFRIYVRNLNQQVANFTIFNPNFLTTEEKDDTGPPSTIKYSTMYTGSPPVANPSPTRSSTNFPQWGLNELGLDNVWIGPMDNYNAASNNINTMKGESNKIIDIRQVGTTDEYYLTTLHAIRGTSTSYSAADAAAGNDPYWDPWPIGTAVYGICSVQPTPTP